jgi:hypothetical protein
MIQPPEKDPNAKTPQPTVHTLEIKGEQGRLLVDIFRELDQAEQDSNADATPEEGEDKCKA